MSFPKTVTELNRKISPISIEQGGHLLEFHFNLLEFWAENNAWKMKIFIQRYIFFQNGQEFVDQTMKILNNLKNWKKIWKYILITYIFKIIF